MKIEKKCYIETKKFVLRLVCVECLDKIWDRLGVEECEYCERLCTRRNRKYNEHCSEECMEDYLAYCERKNIDPYPEW